MAISDEITRLQQAKAALKTSIEGKGVTVSSSATLDDYADLVDSIEAGGGGSIEDLITKENLVKIETNIEGNTPIVLNQNNNFNISNVGIYGDVTFFECEISFNGFSLIWHSDGNNRFRFYNTKKTFLSIGNVDFIVENVPTKVNGWKHIYFYINDEIVGTVAYDD